MLECVFNSYIMKVICIWKVPAQNTRSFIEKMRQNNLRQDSYATLLNHFAGYNFFYETDESFGDVSEFAAEQISKRHGVNVRNFTINGL